MLAHAASNSARATASANYRESWGPNLACRWCADGENYLINSCVDRQGNPIAANCVDRRDDRTGESRQGRKFFVHGSSSRRCRTNGIIVLAHAASNSARATASANYRESWGPNLACRWCAGKRKSVKNSSDPRIFTAVLPTYRFAPNILSCLIAERLGLVKSHLGNLALDCADRRLPGTHAICRIRPGHPPRTEPDRQPKQPLSGRLPS